VALRDERDSGRGEARRWDREGTGRAGGKRRGPWEIWELRGESGGEDAGVGEAGSGSGKCGGGGGLQWKREFKSQKDGQLLRRDQTPRRPKFLQPSDLPINGPKKTKLRRKQLLLLYPASQLPRLGFPVFPSESGLPNIYLGFRFLQ